MTVVLRQARSCVAALRQALLNPAPELWQAQLPALAHATGNLTALANGGQPEDRDGWTALALELKLCAKLIEHGLQATRALAGILAGAQAGYCSTGAPPPLATSSTVSCQG